MWKNIYVKSYADSNFAALKPWHFVCPLKSLGHKPTDKKEQKIN